MDFTLPEDRTIDPLATTIAPPVFTLPLAEPEGFQFPEDRTAPAPAPFDVEGSINNVEFNPAAHAANPAATPEDVNNAYEVWKRRSDQSISEKAGRVIPQVPGMAWNAVKGVGNFLLGIPQAMERPIVSGMYGLAQQENETTDSPPVLFDNGNISTDPTARGIRDSAQRRHLERITDPTIRAQREAEFNARNEQARQLQAQELNAGQLSRMSEDVQQLQHGEESVKNIGGIVQNPVKWVTSKFVTAGMTPEEQDFYRRQQFQDEVEAAKRQLQLSQGKPLAEGVVAGAVEGVTGVNPSEMLSPEGLKSVGAAPSDPDAVTKRSASTDPFNLLPLRFANLPGAQRAAGVVPTVVGGAMEGAGWLASQAGRKGGPAAAILKAASGDVGGAAAIVGGWVGAEGLQKVGKFLRTEGTSALKGEASPLTQNIARARAAGELPLAQMGLKTLSDVGKAGTAAAIGMAPMNYAMADGDFEKFADLEANAAVFGGLMHPTQGIRGELGQAMRPFLRGEGASRIFGDEIIKARQAIESAKPADKDAAIQRLAELMNQKIQGDPLSGETMRYMETMDPKAREAFLEVVGSFGGIKVQTPNGEKGLRFDVVSGETFKNIAGGTGRGFYHDGNGHILINGDSPSTRIAGELQYTLGHEAGGHAALNALEALTSKSGPMADNLRNAVRSKVIENGKATPDFQKFVDSYKARVDSDEIKAKPATDPYFIDEFISETAGDVVSSKGPGQLAIPVGIRDIVSDAAGNMFGSLLGIEPGSIGGKKKFDRTEVGEITSAVSDFLGGIASQRFARGWKPTENIPPQPQAAAAPGAPPPGPAPAPAAGARPRTETPFTAPRDLSAMMEGAADRSFPAASEPLQPAAPQGAPAAPGEAPRPAAEPQAAPAGVLDAAVVDQMRDKYIETSGVFGMTKTGRPMADRTVDQRAEKAGQEFDQLWKEFSDYLAEKDLEAPDNPNEAYEAMLLFGAGLRPAGPGAGDRAPAAPPVKPAASEEPASSIVSKEEPAKPVIEEQEIKDRVAIAEQAAAAGIGPRVGAKGREQRLKQARIEALLDIATEVAEGPDRLQKREEYGETKFTGRLDPSNPVHRAILDEVGAPADTVSYLSENIGKTLFIDYNSAAKEVQSETAGQERAMDVTGKQRQEEYSESTPQDRLDRMADPAKTTGEGVQQGKAFVPLSFRVNPSTGSVTVTGFSPQRLLSNARKIISFLKGNGPETGYKSVNDPNLIRDAQAYAQNHANGYRGDGSAPITGQEPNSSYVPRSIPKNRFDVLNAAFANEAALGGESRREATRAKAGEAQKLAAENEVGVALDTGEVNPLRDYINKSGKFELTNEAGKTRTGTKEILEPVVESLRPELITKTGKEQPTTDESIRQTGFEGDLSALAEEGLPKSKYVGAGFMPETADVDINDIVPAVRVNGEIIKGKKGETHQDIMERAFPDKDDRALAMFDFDTKDNPNFFMAGDRELSRQDLKEQFGIAHSQQLREKQGGAMMPEDSPSQKEFREFFDNDGDNPKTYDEVVKWFKDRGEDVIEIDDKIVADGMIIDPDFEKIQPVKEWLNEAWDRDIEQMAEALGIENDFNKTFWESPGVLYHATVDENVGGIDTEGLGAMNKTRGISNRHVGDAVYTSSEFEELAGHGSYGSKIYEIDTEAMKRDGYTPNVSREPAVEETELRQSVAHKLGLRDYEAYNEEGDMSPSTVVIHGAIPQKYVKRSNFMPEEGKYSVEHWSEDAEDYDPWEMADKAEKAFRNSGLRPMNNKDLGLIAFGKDGEPVGATFKRVFEEDASELGGPEGEDVRIYDFDIGIDPKEQGGSVGYMLTRKAIEDAKNEGADFMRNWVINPKMADMMENLFGFEHEGTPETREGYSTHMRLDLRNHKFDKALPKFMPEADAKLKEWFGNSKVRDEKGNPRRMYHGGSFNVSEDGVFTGWTHFGTKESALDRIGGKVGDDLIESVKVFHDEDGDLGEPGKWYWEIDGYEDETPHNSKEAAQRAGEQGAIDMAENMEVADEAANLTEVYLKLENPLRLPDMGTFGNKWRTSEVLKAVQDSPARLDADELKRIESRVKDGEEGEREELTAILKEKGFDGIVYRNLIEDKGSDSYIAFEPTQIKSATDNSGDFDPSNPDIRFMPEQDDYATGVKPRGYFPNEPKARFMPDESKLVAIHNTNEEGIRATLELGGIPAPSLAITKPKHGFHAFGNISLIAPKEMVDPQADWRNRSFESDIYSKRQPRPIHKIVSKNVRALVDEFKNLRPDWFKLTRGDSPYQIEEWMRAAQEGNAERAVTEATRSGMFQIAFMEEKTGKKLRPRQEPEPIRHKEWVRDPDFEELIAKPMKAGEFSSDYNSEDYKPGGRVPEFIERKAKQEEEKYSDEENKELGKLLGAALRKRYLNEDGSAAWGTFEEVLRDYGNRDKKRWDTSHSTEKARKFTNKHGREFAQWVKKKFEPLFDDPSVMVGKDRERYTLDNVVAAMTRGGPRAKETGGMTKGLGLARSKASKEFKSLEEMKEQADTLLPDEEFQKKKEETQEAFSEWNQHVIPRYRWYAPDSFGQTFDILDSASMALGDYLKGPRTIEGMQRALRKNDFVNVPDWVAEDAIKVAEMLRKSPTEYFESKPQRAVKLNEFKAALVPRTADPEVVKALEEQGLKVYKYKDNEQRKKMLQRAARQTKAAFMPEIENLGNQDIETGKPADVDFLRRKTSATSLMGMPDKDSPFDRGYEPSGRYMMAKPGDFSEMSHLETGNVKFQNPLVLGEGQYGSPSSWKRKLSEQYGGKTGKELSKAIIADGYDGVITTFVDGRGKTQSGEILDLTTFDESKAAFMPEPADVPEMYSQLEKVVREKVQGRVKPEQLRATLKNNGVRDEEIDWTLGDLLDRKGQEAITTKELGDELLANKVRIETIEKTDNGISEESPVTISEGDFGWEEMTIDEARSHRRIRRFYDDIKKWEEENDEPASITLGRYEDTEFLIRPALEDDYADGKPYVVVGDWGDAIPVDSPWEGKKWAIDYEQMNANERREEYEKENGVQFGGPDLTLPGGTNYRELNFILPARPPSTEGWTATQNPKEPGPKTFTVRDRNGNIVTRNMAGQDEAGAISNAQTREVMLGTYRVPQAHRYDDRSDTDRLFHMRINDRETSEGDSMVFIEESQSDLHQSGRDEGYRTPEATKKKNNAEAAKSEYVNELKKIYGDRVGPNFTEETNQAWLKKLTPEEREKMDALNEDLVKASDDVGPVPDFPFKGEGWKRLSLKKAIEIAVKEGKDRIGWTTGEQQSDRYDMSRHVSEIRAHKEEKGYYLNVYDKNGNQILGELYAPEKLPDVIGKELADKIVNQEPPDISEAEQRLTEAQNKLTSGPEEGPEAEANQAAYQETVKDLNAAHSGVRRYSGLDLKVGGEGMRGFYDKEMVNLANDIGKRYGARVGRVKIRTRNKGDSWGRTGSGGNPFVIHHLRDYAEKPPEGVDPEQWHNWVSVENSKTGEMSHEMTREEADDYISDEFRKMEGDPEVWSLPITEKMREAVKKSGLPLFMPEEKSPSSIVSKEQSSPGLQGMPLPQDDEDEETLATSLEGMK